MASTEFSALQSRVDSLRAQFMPALNALGEYSPNEQDQMRALRMLIHAEIEAYLEAIGGRLLADLDSVVRSAKKTKQRFYYWAEAAANECRIAIQSNNGVKGSDIRSIFAPLGIGQDDYDSVSSVFLDRMNSFGKQRGDVAHQSAMRATYTLNAQRENAVIDEILGFIEEFDRLLITHRLRGFS